MDALEELLATEAIRKLRLQYSHYFDGKRLDDLVSIFTDDAVCEFGPDYGGDWVGKSQIRTNYAQYTEVAGPNFVSLHAVTSHMVTFVDATTAHGRCYLLDLNTSDRCIGVVRLRVVNDVSEALRRGRRVLNPDEYTAGIGLVQDVWRRNLQDDGEADLRRQRNSLIG